MIERGEHLRLALQAREPFRIVRKALGQDLQRHLALQPRVARPIHFTHAADAELRNDFVRADPYPRNKRHDARLNVQILTWTP
jgi:hypothetical protein